MIKWWASYKVFIGLLNISTPTIFLLKTHIHKTPFIVSLFLTKKKHQFFPRKIADKKPQGLALPSSKSSICTSSLLKPKTSKTFSWSDRSLDDFQSDPLAWIFWREPTESQILKIGAPNSGKKRKRKPCSIWGTHFHSHAIGPTGRTVYLPTWIPWKSTTKCK